MFGRKKRNYDPQLDIYTWNRAADNKVPDYPVDVSDEDFWVTASMQTDILDEEVCELIDAAQASDRIEYADALADIVIVAYGQAAKAGIDLNEFIREAMESNWSKANPDTGEFDKNEIGKIQKGAAYKKPRMHNVLYKQLMNGGARNV